MEVCPYHGLGRGLESLGLWTQSLWIPTSHYDFVCHNYLELWNLQLEIHKITFWMYIFNDYTYVEVSFSVTNSAYWSALWKIGHMVSTLEFLRSILQKVIIVNVPKTEFSKVFLKAHTSEVFWIFGTSGGPFPLPSWGMLYISEWIWNR